MAFNYSVKSTKPVSEIVDLLEKNLKKVDFGILGILDFQNIFKKKGIEFEREYKLLEICNPVAAKTVLNANPEVGLMLPCTIAVYKDKEDKLTTISLAKPTSILSIVSDPSLTQKIGTEIETKLIDVIDNTK